ncbi:MAG: sarcosine oxidase subunit gamma [Micromonosporaceae bacterium]
MADPTVLPQTCEAVAAGYPVLARSPVPPSEPAVVVAGWEVTGRCSTAALTLVDLTPWSKVQLKATPGGAVESLLGVLHGRSRSDLPGGPPINVVVGSGPGEWLVLAAPGTAGEILAWCREHAAGVGQHQPVVAAATELVSAVDLTHGRALFRITGPHAADTLATVCPIDLSDQVTGDTASFRSAVAEVATEVVRRDTRRGRSYLLHCERSSGRYLFDALLEAGAEYGIDVDGFPYDVDAVPG